MLLTKKDLEHSEFEKSIRNSIGGIFSIWNSMGSSTWRVIEAPIGICGSIIDSIRRSLSRSIRIPIRNSIVESFWTSIFRKLRNATN